MKKINFTSLYALGLCFVAMLFSASVQAQAGAGQTRITINLGTGTFNNEISWDFVNVTDGVTIASEALGAYSGPNTLTFDIDDVDQHEFRAFDSFGDGWNGATVEILASEDASANGCAVPVMGTLVPETVPGGTGQTFSFITGCPACIPDCSTIALPAGGFDFAPGTCEAAITLDNPSQTGDCVGTQPVFTATFDAGDEGFVASGDATPADVGTCGAAIISFDCTNGYPSSNGSGAPNPDFAGNSLVIDDDAAGAGGVGVWCVTSPAIDLSANGGATLEFDYENEDAGGGDLIVNVWDGAAFVQEFLVSGDDFGAASINISAYNNADFMVQFCYDDEGSFAWGAAIDNVVVSEPSGAVPPPTNDSPFANSPTDPSGTYPVGTTTVTFTSTDPNGLEANCSIDVVVNPDTEAPVVNCPTVAPINLDPGECSSVVDYTVTFTENCPAAMVNVMANNTLNLNGTHIACSPGALNQHYQIFDLAALGFNDDLEITAVQVGLENGGIVNGRIYEYTGNPAGPPTTADMTLVASGTVNGTAGVINDIPVATTLTGGGLYVIEVEGTDFFLSYNDDGSASTTYISAPACGIVEPATFTSIGFGERDGVIALAATVAIELTQTAGLPSGSEFPIGTTTNTFEVTDAAGNTGMCSFDVTVNEFANPISTMATNDFIQVSLDEDGCSLITADMVLEGGPYGCYEDYELTRSPVYTGTCPVPANAVVVGCEDIGNTITVTIIDPDTGNSAWAMVTVEDKLAPTIECGDPIEVAACDGQAPPNFGAAPAPVVVTGTSTNTGAVIDNTMAPATATATVSGIPGNAVVDAVTVSIQATHTFVGDLTLELTGPNGATIVLADGDCGGNDNIDIIYDDNGNLVVCSGGAPGMGGVVAPDQPLSTFNGSNANGDWTLTITDNFAGDEGTIDGFAVTVSASLPFVPAATATDNCDVDLTFVDNFFNLDCFDANGNPDFAGRIERTWTATDGSGNTATCVQIINLTRPTLQTIVFPQDITWQCDQFAAYPNITEATALNPSITFDSSVPALHVDPATPDNLLANTGSGLATINGSPITIGDLCEIACDFEDSTVEVCPGTTKILRQWTCIDWCAGESVEFDQIIKVVDEDGPNLINPGDLEVDVFSASAPAAGVHTECEGNPVVPAITDNGDNCSSIASYETQIFSVDAAGMADELLAVIPTNGGQFMNIPLYGDNGAAAEYIVCYTAADECGNETEVCVNLTVFDKVPPVAVCDEITQISITNNNLNGTSCSALAAEDLDDGSYDNCTDVHFLVSRMNNADPTSNSNIYTPFEDFCCEDIPGPVQVILLVLDDVAWDIYLNNYGQIQADGQLGLRGARLDLTNDDGGPLDMDGRWNFCMVEVLVEDKLAPTITCPPNANLTCDEYADDLEAALLACTDGGFAVGGFANEDECQSAALTAAGFGDATAFDNCEVTITPTVTVTTDQCGGGSVVRSFSAVDASGNGGNGPAVCTQTIIITQVSDWVVEFPADQEGFCDQDEPDFGEPEIFFETCELIATSFEDQFFDIVNDACFKIVRTWTVINWCVVGDEIDQESNAVELAENELTPQQDLDGDGDRDGRTFRDSYRGVLPTSDTDPDADNQDGFITYQQIIKVIDEEAPIVEEGFTIETLCIIDGNDGTDNDFSDCTYSGVLPTPEYDDCILDVNGNIDNNGEIVENELVITATVFDADGNVVSNSVVVSDLEVGTYVVRYTATDRCGNTTANDYEFLVDDCKFPTPYCREGVVLELMHIDDPNNDSFEPMIELWASDLDLGSFDNCGPVQLSLSPDVNDVSQVFTCDDVSDGVEVTLYVTDNANPPNQDFCSTFVVIQANQNQCPGDDPQIAGNVATESNDDVQDVTVAVNSTSGFGATETTLANGNFNFDVPANGDYTITPSKDMNPRNGVTTFDLVTISKHILNVESLDSPYKMIAADANNSGTITTLDLVQVRKLILFIDNEFSNNSSWRFVDADYNFPNANNPWAEAFPEVINVNNLTASELNNNFVAVKIGDVNGSANANELLGADDRTNGKLTLNATDVALKAGEMHTVEVSAANFNNFGYQFTMNFDADALEFVEAGNGLTTADNFGYSLLSEGAITTSWNKSEAVRMSAEETVFTMTFVAKADVQLSDVLSINSRYTAAEAYAANGDVQNVELTFNSVAVAGFELYQNTPNPFATETTIGFNLGADKAATLTISDISGKVIKVIEVDGVKGYNQVVLSRNEVAAAGILYYQLDTDTDSATKKMILID